MVTSLVVQWLRLGAPMQGAQVGALVRELESHMQQLRSYTLQPRPGVVK